MEYETTEDGQIQAAFALRAGKLILQYEYLTRDLPDHQRFDSTLTVALLHSMLTICQELLRRGSRSAEQSALGAELPSVAKRFLREDPPMMGLAPECVVECWRPVQELTYGAVFECLRHAVSHPCPQGNTTHPATGYTTIKSQSGLVEMFEFVQSPWVENDGAALLMRYAPRSASEGARTNLKGVTDKWGAGHGVSGLSIVMNEEGFWRVHKGDSLFVPVLRVRLHVRQLRLLALTLSDHLGDYLKKTEGVPA